MGVEIIGFGGRLRVRTDGLEAELLERVREAYDPGTHPLFGLLRHVVGEEGFATLVAHARRMLELELEEEVAELSGYPDICITCRNPDPELDEAAHRVIDEGPRAASILSPGLAVPEPICSDLLWTLTNAAREALRYELRGARLPQPERPLRAV